MLSNTLQGACEAVGVGDVAVHMGLLKPVRGVDALEIQSQQFGRALGQVPPNHLGRPLGHGGGLGVNRLQTSHQVGEVAAHPGLQIGGLVGARSAHLAGNACKKKGLVHAPCILRNLGAGLPQPVWP